MKQEKRLITSALPYANGPLHFGHIAGAYLPGDCYARFSRLQKHDVLYICGSDEYGIAIALSAEMAGRTPKEHVDIYHEVILNFFRQLNMSFDHYSRTTWEGHVETTHQYFKDLLDNGYIKEIVTDQLYSETDGRFLADRYVVGSCPRCGFAEARGDECQKCGASYDAIDLKNPRSKLTNSNLIRKPTKHWFLCLDMFKDRLMTWLETKSWKPNVVNFIKSYIQDMHPRAITRDSSWGIPIPLDGTEGKVLYVWFDAPIGYISATKEWALKKGMPDQWKDYWCDKSTKLVNFIGKDNIPFHASIFPAMTMGQNQPYKLVDELPANEFYNLEGKKFSKSDGWYIDLNDFFTKYTADQIRYTIAANAPETSDSAFTWKDFQARCNAELLGKYGNFVNRVLVFCKNKCQAKAPDKGDLKTVDQEFLNHVHALVDQAKDAYEHFKVRRASQIVMEIAQAGNVYFDLKKPWIDAKTEESKPAMETTIACCLECIKALSLVSYPIIPDTALVVWNFLGWGFGLEEVGWEKIAALSIPAGQSLLEPRVLFQRVEDSQIEEEISKLYAMSAKCEKKAVEAVIEPLKTLVDIETFKQLDLRAGVVIAAEAVPKSKKLLKLTVDLGFEKRTIVSGISQSYKPEEMIGKKVVVVANLKAATLMGIESQGMILAAHSAEGLEVLSLAHTPKGSSIN